MYLSQRSRSLVDSMIDEVMREGRTVAGSISLAGGTPPFALPKSVWAEMAQAGRRSPRLNQYPTSTWGSFDLRCDVARDLSTEFGRPVDSRNVVITAGASPALFSLFLILLEPGDEVLTLTPSWPGYINQVTAAGGILKFVRLDEAAGWEIDMDGLRKALSARSRVLLLCDPHNPTGRVWTGEVKRELLSFAAEHGLVVVADETYRHLSLSDAEFLSIKGIDGAAEQVVLIRSFSKDFAMSGLRVGFVLGPPAIAHRVERLHTAMNLFAPGLSQEIAHWLYQNKPGLVGAFSAGYRERMEVTCRNLAEMERSFSFVRPQGGFFVFPRYHADMDSLAFFRFLLHRARVLVRPGVDFGAAGERHVRLSFCPTVAELQTAFERMRAVLSR